MIFLYSFNLYSPPDSLIGIIVLNLVSISSVVIIGNDLTAPSRLLLGGLMKV